MLGTQRLEPRAEVGAIRARGEVAKIREESHRLVVAFRLIGGDKLLHTLPKGGLRSRKHVEMLDPRCRGPAFASGRFPGRLLGFDPAPLLGGVRREASILAKVQNGSVWCSMRT